MVNVFPVVKVNYPYSVIQRTLYNYPLKQLFCVSDIFRKKAEKNEAEDKFLGYSITRSSEIL